MSDTKYIPAIGRRKRATAQVRITPAKATKIVVNGKDLAEYFTVSEQVKTVQSAFEKIDAGKEFEVSVLVRGGGASAQAEAIRHGISRALIKDNEELRTDLKKLGFLKRDPRRKERKKFGLRKARKSPQWSKR